MTSGWLQHVVAANIYRIRCLFPTEWRCLEKVEIIHLTESKPEYSARNECQVTELRHLFNLCLKFRMFAHPYLQVSQEPVAMRAKVPLIVSTPVTILKGAPLSPAIFCINVCT